VTPNLWAARAFIQTGSLSNRCLATLSESSFAVGGLSVFCNARVLEGKKGIAQADA
jgi:hypothetical protein